MTRMTGPDCAVMCNLINTHTHTRTPDERFSWQVSLIPPWEDQCEWHRMTRMTGPDCAVMCNLINTHTHTHTHRINASEWHRMTAMTERAGLRGYVQFNKYTHTHTLNKWHSPYCYLVRWTYILLSSLIEVATKCIGSIDYWESLTNRIHGSFSSRSTMRVLVDP